MKRLIYISGAILLSLCILFVVAITFWIRQVNRPIDGLKFEELDEATKIVIAFAYYPSASSGSQPRSKIEIDDPEKIEVARNFIKKYPDGWITPFGTPPPGVLFNIEFWAEDRYLSVYGVGSVDSGEKERGFLEYRQTIKFIEPQERTVLLERLQISE